MFIEFVSVLFLKLFLAEVFHINFNELFSIEIYLRTIIVVWLIYHALQVKHSNSLYNRIKRIEKIKSGEYLRNPNIIFQEEINKCNYGIDAQKETLGILKAFSPMAFIVLLAGRFLDNVEVEPLQPLPVIRQLYTFHFPVQFFHNLVDTRFTIIGFHVEKSPAMMCLRASPTSHR